MAFTLRPKDLEVGKAYDLSHTWEGNSYYPIERVAPGPGEQGMMVRLLDEVKSSGKTYPKGLRFRLRTKDTWYARPSTREGRLLSWFRNEDLFANEVSFETAIPGKEYAFLLPGKRLDPAYLFLATLLELEQHVSTKWPPPIRLKLRLAPEYQRAWQLNDPIWELPRTYPLRMFEISDLLERSKLAEKLARVAQSQGIPHELTAIIFEQATGRKPKGYPKHAFTGPREVFAEQAKTEAKKEDQERRTKEQEEMIESLSPEEREVAVAMRGGTRRRRRRRQTRRRK